MSKKSPRDICSYSNGRVMLIAEDRLQITEQYYGSIHAEKENVNGKSYYSRIRITLINYNNSKSEYVYSNLDVDTVRWLHHMANIHGDTFEYRQERVMDGKVKKLQILRQPKDQHGNIKKIPWFISVEEGTANTFKKNNLITYNPSTYKRTTGSFINMSDKDYWIFINRIYRFIEIVENGAANFIWQKKYYFQQQEMEEIKRKMKGEQ